MTASKLFLFQPCQAWKCCGGATIICANNQEEAIELGNKYLERNDTPGQYRIDKGTEHYEWDLVRVFLLAVPETVGVLYEDHNYA